MMYAASFLAGALCLGAVYLALVITGSRLARRLRHTRRLLALWMGLTVTFLPVMAILLFA
jgi:hypothetical protein